MWLAHILMNREAERENSSWKQSKSTHMIQPAILALCPKGSTTAPKSAPAENEVYKVYKFVVAILQPSSNTDFSRQQGKEHLRVCCPSLLPDYLETLLFIERESGTRRQENLSMVMPVSA